MKMEIAHQVDEIEDGLEHEHVGDCQILTEIRQAADNILKQRNALKKKSNIKIGIVP